MNISKIIIDKVSEALFENSHELEDFTLVPNVFDIYTYVDDYNEIKNFLTTLREQIEKRLNEELKKQDEGGHQKLDKIILYFEKLFGIRTPFGKKQFRRNEDTWDISFKKTEGIIQFGENIIEIKAGEICIVASISSPDFHSLDVNLGTLITLYKVDGSSEKSLIPGKKPDRENNNPYETFVDLSSQIQPEDTLEETSPLAKLRYKYEGEDETKVFLMRKEKIVIGRQTHADLVLFNASNRISRKHLEIRCDNGKFFMKSFGVYGTTLNGQPVPNSEKVVENVTQDLDCEVEIPNNSQISLSGGEILIDFIKGVGQ